MIEDSGGKWIPSKECLGIMEDAIAMAGNSEIDDKKRGKVKKIVRKHRGRGRP